MKKQSLHNPHDKLFKASLKYPAVAREFLELHLPESIKQHLDFDTVTNCDITLIDDTLNLTQTDVLFKCRLASHEAYIYILAEHESNVDPLIAFWLMKYMISIWDHHIKVHTPSKALPLPVIFPLVFYTGDSQYTAPREFWQLFGEHSEEMKSLFTAPFHLIETSTIPEDVLLSHMYAGTLGFILRKYFRKNIQHELQKIINNLNRLEQCELSQYVVQLLQYMLNIDEGHKNINELIEVLKENLSPKLENTMSSLAEKLILEGERKGELRGELRGELKGKLKIAQTMLNLGSEPVFVAQATGLQLEQIKELQKKIKQ